MRSKKFRKYLQWYRINFNVIPPFTVLLDATFISWAASKSVAIHRLIPKLLSATANLKITKCCLSHIGTESAAQSLAKRCRVYECGHEIDNGDCIESLVKENSGKFVVGCQDNDKRIELGKIPGVPLLFLSNNVLMLEPPSPTSYRSVSSREEKQLEAPEPIKEIAHQAARRARRSSSENGERITAALTHVRQQHKRAKGPNPLSCKKKQKKPQEQPPQAQPPQTQPAQAQLPQQEGEQPKRKRKRNRTTSTTSEEPPTKKLKTKS